MAGTMPVKLIVMLTAMLTAVVMVAAGCAETKRSSLSPEQQYSQLLQRPDIEDAESQYLALLESIRSTLVSTLTIAPWQTDDRDQISGSGCGFDFSDVDGAHIRRYSSGFSPGNLPDAQWANAVALIADIARPLGFGEPAVVVDRPSDHEVAFRNQNDATIIFGTATNTVLSLSTGCHLSKAARERGTPRQK